MSRDPIGEASLMKPLVRAGEGVSVREEPRIRPGDIDGTARSVECGFVSGDIPIITHIKQNISVNVTFLLRSCCAIY